MDTFNLFQVIWSGALNQFKRITEMGPLSPFQPYCLKAGLATSCFLIWWIAWRSLVNYECESGPVHGGDNSRLRAETQQRPACFMQSCWLLQIREDNYYYHFVPAKDAASICCMYTSPVAYQRKNALTSCSVCIDLKHCTKSSLKKKPSLMWICVFNEILSNPSPGIK